MKLLIISLANSFTPTMLYKENYIIKAALEVGHQVHVMASPYTYIDGFETKVGSGFEILDGYTCKRYEYKKIAGNFISGKLRVVDDIEDDIIEFNPDLIFFNSPQIYLVSRLKEIKKKLPDLKIVLDFSTKYINSATNWVSLNILHKIIYRRWLQLSLPYIDKAFYISIESKWFAHDIYKIPNEIMEHNNLPGELISIEQKKQWRDEIINLYSLPENCILFSHSGKMGKLKKTIELLRVFLSFKDINFRLIIAGSFSDEIEKEAKDLIEKDDRIIYVGFLTGNELNKILSASDIYLQPGTISQTSQTAICCGCPIAFTNIPTNQELYNGNGFFIDNDIEILNAFKTISNNPDILSVMSEKSFELAKNELSYQVIYEKILKAVSLDV